MHHLAIVCTGMGTRSMCSSEPGLEEIYSNWVVYTFSDELPQISAVIGEEYIFITVESDQSEDCASVRNPCDADEVIPPPMIAAFITAKKERIEILRRLHDKVRARGSDDAPEPVLLRSYKKSDLQQALIQSGQKLLSGQAKLIVRLSRELARLRIEYEDLNKRHENLQNFLRSRGEQPFYCAYSSIPPDEIVNAIGAHPNGARSITQLIPTSSLGVTAIALYIDRPSRTTSPAKISLHSMEENTLLANWIVDPGKARHGWNTFTLRNSISGMPTTLMLRIEVDTVGSVAVEPIKFVLGSYQPIRRFRPHDSFGRNELAKRHIAIKVWVGLPGMIAPDFISLPPASQTGEVRLAGNAFEHLRQKNGSSSESLKICVNSIKGSISLSAEATQSPVVELPQVIPPFTARISVAAKAPADRSSDASFRVAVRRATFRSGDPELEQALEWLSDWISVKSGTSCTEHFYLSDQMPEARDLVLQVKSNSPTRVNDLALDFESIKAFFSRHD